MKLIALVVISIGLHTTLLAQDEVRINKGLLCGQLTLSPGHMLNTNHSYFYLHGGIETFMSSHLSFAGEAFYQLGAISRESEFSYHNDFFFGASWHLAKKNGDFFLGMQPGLSFDKLNHPVEFKNVKGGISPIVSFIAGYRLFVGRNFNFFFQSRLIAGNYAYYAPRSLAELRVSAGLGFNLFAK